MKIEIQAPWEVNDYLKGIIKGKVEKFNTYFTGIIHADVFLKLKEHDSPNDKIVEVRLSVPGPYVFAEANADSYEKAMASVAEKIKKQLLKRKEKAQSR